ncbi:hypothetical protein [Streptomyces chrestomyceticus]|uniref:hypothetical protein n=1 Tax=Streptomyces chrestomyceticus TaxID=68185 RepID=UPI003556F3F3
MAAGLVVIFLLLFLVPGKARTNGESRPAGELGTGDSADRSTEPAPSLSSSPADGRRTTPDPERTLVH